MFSLQPSKWIQNLQDWAWVPDKAGDLYRPEQILPPTVSPNDYDNEPIAVISAELYEQLSKHNVVFGKNISKSSVIRRLVKSKGVISPNQFGELIKEFSPSITSP